MAIRRYLDAASFREGKQEMGSWVRCKCNQLVHKNLFCGTGMSLLATEEFLDENHVGKSADDLVDDLVLRSELLLTCSNCGRIILMKETKDVFEVRFFKPEKDG